MLFYSHPEKLMVDHLNEVNDNMKEFLKEEYKEESYIIAFCHDFGKYTTYFQKYLLEEHKKSSLKSNHGFISALFGAYIGFSKFEEDSNLPLIIYDSILHHHGRVKNPKENLPKGLRGLDFRDEIELVEKVEIAKDQINNIKNNKEFIIKDYESVGLHKEFLSFLELNNLEEILTKLKRIHHRELKKKNSKIYFNQQLQYSALIASDKLSAAGVKLPELKHRAYKFLDKSRKRTISKGNKESTINKIRTEIFNKVNINMETSYKEHSIFSITSPTGTGKTYSGFFAALKLKELLKDNRKIIYSLPFTSIINQNFDVVYELFKDVENFENKSSQYIIKHHSLANVEYKTEYEQYKVSQAEMLLENWNSSIIITTFVQLLETLIGNRNRMLKKFYALRGSIILLDEVQAIDVKYYPLVEYIFENACKYLDCKIILMTATKPLILKDAYELLENNKEYFKSFNRTKLIPKLDKISIEEFVNEFTENVEEKSYLIICNTINQSLKIFNSLKNINREVFYLSTNLLPIHRKEKIELITKKLKEGFKPILVSTQVVEAGVDFDFDVVIRDIAPMSSIIQSAGRCNRHGKEEKIGEVYVYSMCDDSCKTYGQYVYGKTNIEISKDILQGKEEISEKDYLEIIGEYFKTLSEIKNMDDSKYFIEAIENLAFTKEKANYNIGDFRLIEENLDYMDVIFRVDEEGEKAYSELLSALGEKDEELKKEKYLKIKNKIRDYTLSVPIKKYKDRFNKEEYFEIFNLPEEGCKTYYNDETGFIREEGDQLFIF
ncbi:CRISPR-associated helicase Cas3' [Hathewaya histolytica]|uniref:CRISPR-associated helicase Cas3' n=1 Tax=Hathewaya histolytica TaxID=1498 RepID=UPI003B66DCFD